MRRSRPRRSSHLPLTSSPADGAVLVAPTSLSGSLFGEDEDASVDRAWPCRRAGITLALVILVLTAATAAYLGVVCAAQASVRDAMEVQLREARANRETIAEEQKKIEVRKATTEGCVAVLGHKGFKREGGEDSYVINIYPDRSSRWRQIEARGSLTTQ